LAVGFDDVGYNLSIGKILVGLQAFTALQAVIKVNIYNINE
jgi:hypothetical protein